MVYRLILSYRGAGYAGWQRQQNAVAVQQVVEEGLSDLLRHRVRIEAAGRTDAGVHASGQAAHFEVADDFPLRGLVHATNQRLPEAIRVLAAARMADGFHARKCAAAKEYHYRLVVAEVVPATSALQAVGIRQVPDLAALDTATAALIGRHDFTAFALAGGGHRSPLRRILAADWRLDGDRLTFRVAGSGFLRGMVRSLVGTLLEVGHGRRTQTQFAALLGGRPRSEAGPTAPAQGLCLERVVYPPPWQPVESYPAEASVAASDRLSNRLLVIT